MCMWVQHSPKVDWLHDSLATISEACSVASGQGSKVGSPPPPRKVWSGGSSQSLGSALLHGPLGLLTPGRCSMYTAVVLRHDKTTHRPGDRDS